MHPFLEALMVPGAIATAAVVAIIVLTLFYRAISWLSEARSPTGTIAARGVIKKDSFVNVHLSDGQTFERVRFIGVTRTDTGKSPFPYELGSMAILEDERTQRYLVRAKNIKMIVVPPDSGVHARSANK